MVASDEFQIDFVSLGREKEIVYREGDRRLDLYFELTGPRSPYDYVAGVDDFASWTVPEGQQIPPKQQCVIRTRIEEWARGRRLRLGFVQTVSPEEHFAQMERDGWTREDLPNGNIRYTPPPRGVLVKRLWRRLWKR